jgi:hypothetical protein
MGFRRLQAEEYNPAIPNYAEQMRSISDLTNEETRRIQDMRARGQTERLAREEEGLSNLLGGIKEGVVGGMDRFKQNQREARQEKRLQTEEERAARAETRADKVAAMQEEEFGLRKPELQAQAETARQRAALGIRGQEAGIRQSEGSARLTDVQAKSAEREQAYLSAQSTLPGARVGETNQDYMRRKADEKDLANLDLAKEQLASVKELRPFQVAQIRSGIAAQGAATEAQQMQTAQLKEDMEVKRLTAIATAPTPEDLQRMAPNLAAKVNSGEISPERAAQVIGAIKSQEVQKALQQQLVNNASPQYQDRMARTFAAQDKAENYLSAIAEMESALAANKANTFFTDDGARERFASMLDGVGMSSEAEKIRRGVDIGAIGDADNPLGLTGRMETILAKVKASARAQMNVLPDAVRQDPKVSELVTRINSIDSSGAVGGASKPSLFGAPPQQNASGTVTPGGLQPLPSKSARKRVAPAQVGGPKK